MRTHIVRTYKELSFWPASPKRQRGELVQNLNQILDASSLVGLTRMTKNIAFFVIILFVLFHSNIAFAESSYVLPYPSTMPGTIFYKLRIIEEKVMKYWYFGNYGQFNYNLKEADKYLVEAKTLFEYKQYLLGAKALQESDSYFSNTLSFLENAKSHGKNISDKRELLHQAALKHVEVLTKIESDTPSDFLWSPEKTTATPLPLRQLLNNSIVIRKKYL